MPLSTDVNLPKKHKAKFPDRCVVCGADSPELTVRIMTTAIGWWTWVTWFWGKPFTVRAPACSGCGWMLHFRRVGSLLTTIALIAAAMLYLWPLISDDIPRGLRKWIMLGMALLCLAPHILFQVYFPDPFDITAKSDSVDYEFRDPKMAYEFAELNEDAEWVRIT